MSTLIWRITNERFAKTAFSGEGARLNGGRWNSVGYPVVYTAGTLALAILEILVHTKIRQLPLTKFVVGSVELPDDLAITTYTSNQLPADWRAVDCPALRDIGDRWFTAAATVALQVPSAVVPQENNYLLNPNHPDFIKLDISDPEPFVLDQRLWA